MGGDTTRLFIDIALEGGTLTEQQLRECQQGLKQALAAGVKVSLQKVAVDKGYLTDEQLQQIRREMRKRGVPTRLGKYEILAKLGQGGMGAVYKGRDTVIRRLVALKVLPREHARNPDFFQRFEREAKLADLGIARSLDEDAVSITRTGAVTR